MFDLIIVLSLLAVVVHFVWGKDSKKKVKGNNSKKWPSKSEKKLEVAQQQLADIQKNFSFNRKGLLDDTEYHALRTISRVIRNENVARNIFILPQVALGSYLTHPYIHRHVNSKRTDFLLVNKGYHPVAAIEINGTGHSKTSSGEHDMTASIRDEIKKRALEGAGIKYRAVEFSSPYCESGHFELENAVRDIVISYRDDRPELFM